MAGGAGRGLDSVECSQDVRPDPAEERDVEGVRQSFGWMAVEDDAVADAGAEAIPESIAQAAGLLERVNVGGELAGLAKGRRQENALGPGSPSGFVAGPRGSAARW